MVNVESWGDGRFEIEDYGVVWDKDLVETLEKLRREEEGEEK